MLSHGHQADLYIADHRIFTTEGKGGDRAIRIVRAICPSPKCREVELSVHLHEWEVMPGSQPDRAGKRIRYWQLAPDSSAKVIPDYVPQAIRGDYYESCRIVAGSPKASATLARRCLQGMIRDFWQIKKSNLATAIRALKSRVETDEYDAIDAIRRVGNIGAHMEKNVNLIIDVDPGGAEKLLRLIESLIEEWYVRRHKKAELLAAVREIADGKGALKKAAKKEVSAALTGTPSEKKDEDPVPAS